jgi:uncharacterized surface protein with fasciclin (FAS1) repeats
MEDPPMHVLKRPLAMLLVLVAASLFAVACGDDESSSSDSSDTTAETESEDATEEDDAMMEEGDETIVDLAVGNEDLSTLVTAVTAADLVETLSGEGPFTVFAPNNAAFEKVDKATLDALLAPEGKEDLTGVLTYHVVPSAAMAGDLTDGQELTTVNGAKLKVSIDGDTVKIGDATVIAADVKASNGVVHVIDTVLIPPAA